MQSSVRGPVVRSAVVAAAIGVGGLVLACVWSHPAMAAGRGGSDPFRGGASNFRQVFSDWAPVLLGVIAGGLGLHHFGSRDYGRLVLLMVAGAAVGWMIADPSGHLTWLGTQLGSLLGFRP
jgi:hypothetical protein